MNPRVIIIIIEKREEENVGFVYVISEENQFILLVYCVVSLSALDRIHAIVS
jgi:hypothetical protein